MYKPKLGLLKSIATFDDPHQAFRAMLVYLSLVVLDFIMAGFFFLHLLYTKNIPLTYVSLAAVVIISSILLYLRKHQNSNLSGHYASIAIILFFPIYVLLNQNNEFGLIWLFFVPFLIISFVGWRIGLRYLGLFFISILTLAYINIGVWEHGFWSQLSFIRLSIGLFLGTTLAIVIDISHEILNASIKKQRRKEVRYLAELKRISTTDGLTTLYNRHYFTEMTEKLAVELKGSHLYVTFFILDVDHFKLYNDCFGHQKGDEVLKTVASTISDFIKRRDDLVFRIGGEEFGGLIVNDKPIETARWVAQLTDVIEELKIEHATQAPTQYITVSIGVFSSQIEGLQSMDFLYKTADEALYKAKESGRNKTVIFDPERVQIG